MSRGKKILKAMESYGSMQKVRRLGLVGLGFVLQPHCLAAGKPSAIYSALLACSLLFYQWGLITTRFFVMFIYI